MKKIVIIFVLSISNMCLAQTHYDNLKEADRQRALTNERNKERDRQNLDNNRPVERNNTNSSGTNSEDVYKNAAKALLGDLGYEEKKVEAPKVEYVETYSDYRNSNAIGYWGQSEYGKKNGYGFRRFESGNVYEGEYVNDKRHGKGVFKWKDGGIYQGDFVEDERTGYGKFFYDDGSVYQGNFLKGHFSGKGSFKNSNGNEYEGDFLNDLFHGKGKYTYKSGSVYIGDFSKSKFQGNGVLYYIDGDIYEGEFSDDECHGSGKFIKKSGYYYSGIFKKGFPKKVNYYNPSNLEITKEEFDKNK